VRFPQLEQFLRKSALTHLAYRDILRSHASIASHEPDEL
jgi:hypothetical protein